MAVGSAVRVGAVQTDGGFGGACQNAAEFKIELDAFQPPARFGTAGEKVGIKAGQQGDLHLRWGHAGCAVGRTAIRALRIAMYLARSTVVMWFGEVTLRTSIRSDGSIMVPGLTL